MPSASDHLLRTMAAVSIHCRVLDLECGEGAHTAPLLRLGFDVYACDHSEQHVAHVREWIQEKQLADGEVQRVSVAKPNALGYPDGFFDWIVATGLLWQGSSRRELLDDLEEARRVLAPGGWIYVLAPALDPDANPREETPHYAGDSGIEPVYTPDTLDDLLHEAGFLTAEGPDLAEHTDEPLLHGIYRRAEDRVAA